MLQPYLLKQSYHIIDNYPVGGNVPRNKKVDRSDLVVELADTVLHVARKLRAYSLKNPSVVPLSPLESLVLLHVHRHPGVSPSDLAQELALRSSNAATAVRGLVEKGQVERRPDPSDKRAARLHLTAAAERSIVTVRQTWRGLLAEAEISEKDLGIAVGVLTAIDATLAEP
ncbi:MarR family transcriptional regulator [Enterobacter hormaechei]|nr:MarR family transcriptional regulator [Enterobacter hormaechei]